MIIRRDAVLGASLAGDSATLCDDVRTHHLADATQLVHHEHPDTVNRLLLDFLSHRTDTAS